MSIINKYKEKLSKDYADEKYDGKDDSGSRFRDVTQFELWTKRSEDFNKGFDSVIALDLPAKFTEWKDKNIGKIGKDYPSELWGKSLKELYQYWINNIFKLE